MASPVWTFGIVQPDYTSANSSTWPIISEINNAKNMQLQQNVSKPNTASFDIRADNSVAQYVENGQNWVAAWRDGVPYHLGPIVNVEESGDSQGSRLAITSMDPAWFFKKRVVGKTGDGRVVPGATSRGTITATLWNDTDFEVPAHIEFDGLDFAGGSITDYNPGPYRVFESVLAELTEGLDGFEWLMWAQQTGTSDVAQWAGYDVYGVVATEAIFEYSDDGKGAINNVASYRKLTNRDQQATRVWVINRNETPAGINYALDNTKINEWGLLEDTIETEITDDGMRQELADEHVRIRKNPKLTYEFTPTTNPEESTRVPRYGTEYSLGDTVRFRVKQGTRTRFDVAVRVWSVTFSLMDNGIEQLTLGTMENS
jgi:hypothetical protein